MITALKNSYSYLFETDLLEEIAKVATLKTFEADDIVIDIGVRLKFIPLLMSGVLKVMREDKEGDDLFLYYLQKGETCAMTLSCCMDEAKSKVRAVAETPVSLCVIPKDKMGEWLGKYKGWQKFILQSYQNKLQKFIEAVDTIAFLNMDKRLSKYLKDKVAINGSPQILITHQEVANDLYTSRVVVSRLLKSLEKEGKIKLSRNQIEVINC